MEPQHPNSLCAHRVLNAAMEVFCKEGYNASIDAVSQHAGVARQTIYNNFGNKQQLFCEAPRFPELAAGFHEIFMIHGHHQIAGILEQAMRAGQLRQEDPTETAQAFLDMLVSAEKSRCMFGCEMPRITPETELQRTRHVVAAFLRAYATHSLTTPPVSSPEDCPIS